MQAIKSNDACKRRTLKGIFIFCFWCSILNTQSFFFFILEQEISRWMCESRSGSWLNLFSLFAWQYACCGFNLHMAYVQMQGTFLPLTQFARIRNMCGAYNTCRVFEFDEWRGVKLCSRIVEKANSVSQQQLAFRNPSACSIWWQMCSSLISWCYMCLLHKCQMQMWKERREENMRKCDVNLWGEESLLSDYITSRGKRALSLQLCTRGLLKMKGSGDFYGFV